MTNSLDQFEAMDCPIQGSANPGPLVCYQNFGQIHAKLENLEQNQANLWEVLAAQNDKLDEIRLMLATHRGITMTIASGLSAAIAFVTAWFTKRPAH